MRQIVAIVEGPGDAAALPVLIRLVLEAQGGPDDIQVLKPIFGRKGKADLLRAGELERQARRALNRTKGDARVLVLIDADDDCAATLGPQLQQRLDSESGTGVCAAVVAVREYENWLIADEAALDAKRTLSDRRTDERSYRPTADQAHLTAQVDVETIREHCPSFRKLWREIARLAH